MDDNFEIVDSCIYADGTVAVMCKIKYLSSKYKIKFDNDKLSCQELDFALQECKWYLEDLKKGIKEYVDKNKKSFKEIKKEANQNGNT